MGSGCVPSSHPSCTSPTIQVSLWARPHMISHRHATTLCERRTDTWQLGGLHASSSVPGTEATGQSPPSPRAPGAHELCGWGSSEEAHPLIEN